MEWPIKSTNKLIPVESIQNDALFLALENGSMVNIHPKKEVSIDSVFQYLKQKKSNFLRSIKRSIHPVLKISQLV